MLSKCQQIYLALKPRRSGRILNVLSHDSHSKSQQIAQRLFSTIATYPLRTTSSPSFRGTTTHRQRIAVFTSFRRHVSPPSFRTNKHTHQVTCNGQDYTDSGTTFLYQADASVHNVSLSAGLNPGGFGLFITGEGFVNSTSLCCRVGGSNTPATFLSSTVVLCFVPRTASVSIRGSSVEEATAAESGGGEGSGEGVVRGFGPRKGDDGSSPDVWLGPLDDDGKIFFVEVSNNGLDFTADRVSYTVEQACPGGSFCVGPGSASILPCPQVTRNTVVQMVDVRNQPPFHVWGTRDQPPNTCTIWLQRR